MNPFAELEQALEEREIDGYKGQLWRLVIVELIGRGVIKDEAVFAAVEAAVRSEWPRLVATGVEAKLQDAIVEFRSEARDFLRNPQ